MYIWGRYLFDYIKKPLFWSFVHTNLIPGWQGGTSHLYPLSLFGSLHHNPAVLHNVTPSLAATVAFLMALPCKQQTLARNVVCEASLASLHFDPPPTRLHPVTTVKNGTHRCRLSITSALLSITRVVSHWLLFCLDGRWNAALHLLAHLCTSLFEPGN